MSIRYSIMPFAEEARAPFFEFLKRHENSSLFLLGNFDNYGPLIGSSPYSGNFKMISDEGKIVGVFCLTIKGSLLIESEVGQEIFKPLLDECLKENIPIRGVVGNWPFASSFWSFLKERGQIGDDVFVSKEILYTLDLSKTVFKEEPHVRLLAEGDFAEWKPLRLTYLEEEGLPSELTEVQFKEHFLDKVRRKVIWGLFHEGALISMADLNAKALDLGQVGGVYTAPAFRNQGYSKAVMRHLIHDAKKLHSLRKLIIFTGEKNQPAQAVYRSLGVHPVGFFALLFGKAAKAEKEGQSHGG